MHQTDCRVSANNQGFPKGRNASATRFFLFFFVLFAVAGNAEEVIGTKSNKRQFGLLCLGKGKELVRLRHKGHQNYYQERVTSF